MRAGAHAAKGGALRVWEKVKRIIITLTNEFPQAMNLKHKSAIITKTAFGALVPSIDVKTVITAIFRSVSLRPFNSFQHIRWKLFEYSNVAIEKLPIC
jgi:hypothetical protein